MALIERALADEGPLARAELGARIAAAGIRSEGRALVHLLALAARRGVAVLAELAELARRYLGGHGPATPADLAAWAGSRSTMPAAA